MSKVTQGVKEFFNKSGQADTTEVCSEQAPEVVQEHVRPQEHVQASEAVDRERHIHHHQHRVQPIEHKQTLDAKHVHSTGPEITREHKEDMRPEHQQTLDQQRTMHQNATTHGDVERSHTAVGTHVNEHQHHHIHETVQPVIQRETVQPTVVHQTHGIHEKVHDAPIVHESTTLPTISHDAFRKGKEGIKGSETHGDKGHQHQFFEGAPDIGGGHSHTGTHTGSTGGLTGNHSGKHTGITGNNGSSAGNGAGVGSTNTTGSGGVDSMNTSQQV